MDLFSGYVDDIIRPHVTRRRLCQDLEMLSKKDLKNPWKKHGNIPLWKVFKNVLREYYNFIVGQMSIQKLNFYSGMICTKKILLNIWNDCTWKNYCEKL